MNEELKPCPLCGREVYASGGYEEWRPTFGDPDSGGDPYHVRCDCGLDFCVGCVEYDEFVKAWNRRFIMEQLSDDDLDKEIKSIYSGGQMDENIVRLALQELKKRRKADSDPLDIKGQLRMIRDRCPDIYTRICNGPDCAMSFDLKVIKDCNYPTGDCTICFNKALEGE